jgi:site-specific DNA-methyltransferase (adenine-specific)
VRPISGSILRLAHKKGADRGIDGRLYFVDDATNRAKQIILSVKSGHLQPAYVRELRGVMKREKAEMGALLTLHEPTATTQREALATGVYTSPGLHKEYQRFQIVTVADLLAGRGIAYSPPMQTNVTQ